MGILAIAGVLVSDLGFMVPLSGPYDKGDYPFHLLDLSHLEFKLNFLVFCNQTLIATLPLSIYYLLSKRNKPSSTEQFLVWAALGTFAFLFLCNSMLGIRDWDLMSISTLPMMALVTVCIVNSAKNKKELPIIFASLAIFAFSFAGRWVGINSNEKTGVEYLSRVSDGDEYTGANRIQQAFMLDKKGYHSESVKQLLGVDSWNLNARKIDNLGKIFSRLNWPDSTIKYIKPEFYATPPLTTVKENLAIYLTYAYDKIGQYQTANKIYLDMRIFGQVASNEKKILWTSHSTDASNAVMYAIAHSQADKLDTGVFFMVLRHFTIIGDLHKAYSIYAYLLTRDLSLEPGKKR